MPQRHDKWNAGWHTATWASAKGLWRQPTPEEEAADHHAWHAACEEEDGFFAVLWCEIRQLFGDLLHYKPPVRSGESPVAEAAGHSEQSPPSRAEEPDTP